MSQETFSITLATKCNKCKKAKGNHQHKTGACPIGKKSRVGYTTYSSTDIFDPKGWFPHIKRN